MPQTKLEKRKGALERLLRGPKNPGSDQRVKKNPRTEEEKQAEIKRLQHLIGYS